MAPQHASSTALVLSAASPRGLQLLACNPAPLPHLPALQRKDSDLGRAAAAQEAQSSQLDELKAAVEKGAQVCVCRRDDSSAGPASPWLRGEPWMAVRACLPPPIACCTAMHRHSVPATLAPQERERLVLQAQQLQAQLAKQAEEAREGNLRMAQLVAQLDDKTEALDSMQVGRTRGCWQPTWLVARRTRMDGASTVLRGSQAQAGKAFRAARLSLLLVNLLPGMYLPGMYDGSDPFLRGRRPCSMSTCRCGRLPACPPCLQAELREVTGGKVSSDSHRQDLQARLAALGREKGEVETELRQVGVWVVEGLWPRRGGSLPAAWEGTSGSRLVGRMGPWCTPQAACILPPCRCWSGQCLFYSCTSLFMPAAGD